MQNKLPQKQPEKMSECMYCQKYIPSDFLNFMVQFNVSICKECYQAQSMQIMAYKQAKPTLYPSFDQIDEGLYLGNEDAASDVNTFESKGISAVCVCGDYLLTPFEQKFQYKKYAISDCIEQKIMHLFDENFEWITKMRQENKKVLVHCAAGVSRSASFVIAYLMKSKGLPFWEAHNLVKSKRSIIRPNSGFIKQLQEYENHLLINKVKNQQKKNE